jgi:hypothetical protein
MRCAQHATIRSGSGANHSDTSGDRRAIRSENVPRFPPVCAAEKQPMTVPFTDTQGQYLAYIATYTKCTAARQRRPTCDTTSVSPPDRPSHDRRLERARADPSTSRRTPQHGGAPLPRPSAAAPLTNRSQPLRRGTSCLDGECASGARRRRSDPCRAATSKRAPGDSMSWVGRAAAAVNRWNMAMSSQVHVAVAEINLPFDATKPEWRFSSTCTATAASVPRRPGSPPRGQPNAFRGRRAA